MNELLDNQILHRWQEGQSRRSIARELGVSRWRISRVLARHQGARSDASLTATNSSLPQPPRRRSSKLDAFDASIARLLERYPSITATRVLEELQREGYEGSYTILRDRVKPWACRPRRPQTKGKVERPFYYVETSLLNGRSFRSLEHLNEVARWWLANVADVRNHRSTGKRPVDAHAEEVPFLLPLPQHDYDTARVVYRLVDAEGLIQLDNNRYSAPWQLIGEILPVRVTETELILYDRQIQPLARHPLLRGQVGQRQTDPSHRPPRDHREQLEMLRQRFAELGEIGSRFLEGLLKKQRYAKHQASRVLALLQTYHRADLLAAMQRAVRYHAYALSSLERILALQATPKPSWQAFGADQQELLERLTESDAIPPRSSAEYQRLLFEEKEPDDSTPGQEPPGTDPEAPADAEDPTER